MLSFQKSKAEMKDVKFAPRFGARSWVSLRCTFNNLVCLAVLFWTGGSGTARAEADGAASLPQLACAAAGRAAEHVALLPANMLVSIGLVESGRVDPVTGRVGSWPWTVNVDGVGHYFQGERDAAAFVQLAASSGAKDIDVGCFQISLEHHPDAFSSLDAAFDPTANANFAARFLDQLKVSGGSWDAAIADYHSAFPELGLPYRQLVLDAWRRIGDVQPGSDTLSLEAADPVVILEAPAARLVRVITMDGDADAPAIGGLPIVITP